MSKIESSLAEMEAFSSMKELLRGNMGIMGWDGHSPMHVQETKPTGIDVRIGDMWYQPSSERMFLFNGEKWPEVLRDGPIGLEGERGPAGKNGKDSTVPGPKGKDGKDGKDFDISSVRPIVDTAINDHEKEFDHELIDPFLLGTKKVNEKGMEKGMFLQYKGKGELAYSTIKDIAKQITPYQVGRGFALPDQTGNSGKVLTSGGSSGSETWTTVAGTGDVVGPASATANNVALFDGTTGKLIKDSGLALSGTNTGDQSIFKTIAISGQSDVVADSTTDTLTLIAGSNITLTTNATNDSITITGSAGGSGITRSIVSASVDTTAAEAASTDYVYFCSSTINLTLPTCIGNTNLYVVKNTGVGVITVLTTGGQTIDGSASASMPVANTSLSFISNNTEWKVV